jgi:hypothetical protein
MMHIRNWWIGLALPLSVGSAPVKALNAVRPFEISVLPTFLNPALSRYNPSFSPQL